MQLLLVLLILTLAGVLRFHDIAEHSLWLDEFWVAELSSGRGSMHLAIPEGQLIYPAPALTTLQGASEFRSIPGSLDSVTHPPLFFMALRAWRQLMPDGDGAMRALAAICSIISIGLLYRAVRLQSGAAAALWGRC